MELRLSKVWSHILHLSLPSFNKYSLSAYYGMGTALGTWDSDSQTRGQGFCLTDCSMQPSLPGFLTGYWH